MRTLTLLLVLVFTAVALSGCQWRRTDRRWISDRRFLQVWEHYQATGDREETEAIVRAQHWRRGEINEALYRLDQLIRAEEIHGEVDTPPLSPLQVSTPEPGLQLD